MATMSEIKSDVSYGSQLKTDDPAAQYWGYLFKRNRSPTEKLDRLLRGIAVGISKKHPIPETRDLTPSQLASFYKEVGGNYDPLFIDNDASSIAFVYKSLGCLHSLQPDLSADDADYSAPSIPALKPRGFVTWQTIQLLLGPQEHAVFLQNALKQYDIRDPESKQPFPKILPLACFPAHPDPGMERWHDSVAHRLQADVVDATSRHREIAHHSHSHSRPVSAAADGPSTPGTERDRYFSDSHHRTASDDRPKIVRSFSKAAPPKLKEGGKAVALTVRNIANPFLWSGGSNPSASNDHGSRQRKHSRDARVDDEDYEHHHSSSRPRLPRQGSQSTSRPRAARRSRSGHAPGTPADSTSDERPPPRHQPRRHRSHDPSTNEYFGRGLDSQEQTPTQPSPSTTYLNDLSNPKSRERERRKSADYGRQHSDESGSQSGGRRAHFSANEGRRKSSGSALSPDDGPPRAPHSHRKSVGGRSPNANLDGHGGRSISGRPRAATNFKDPWSDAGSHVSGPSSLPAGVGVSGGGAGSDTGAPSVRFDRREPRMYSRTADANSSTSSMSGGSVVSPRDSTPAHRYVTPGGVNGVRGRAYPGGEGYR